MKDLFTCFSNFWSNILGAPHSAPLGTRWKPAGNLHSLSMCVVMFVLLFVVGVGNVWGAVTTYTFSNKSWNATSGGSAANWTSNGDGNDFSNNGVKVLGDGSAAATSPTSFTNVTKVVVTYNTNKSGGSGTIKIKIGTNSEVSNSAGYSGSADGRTANFTSEFNFSPGQTGNVKLSVAGTTNSLYIVSIEITTAAAGPTITTSVSSLTEVGYSTADFSQQVKYFTVSGSSLTANVTVTAPTNYEVCKTSGGTYTSSVSFDKGSGTLATSTVYVRLQSGKTAGNYSGNVACSSSGATTKNVAVSGSVPFTVTWKANGTTHATTYVTYATGTGTALGSLPDDPAPSDYTCSPKAFYGWYDGVSYSNASVAPSVISTSTKITTDKTYNAVFADVSGSSESLIELVGFESAEGYTASTTYNSSSYYTGSTGSKWKINYGAFSTNNALVGSQSAQFRVYNAGNYGKLYNSVAYGTNITKIKFRGRVTNTKLDVLVKVSSDGSSWSDNIYEQSLKTTKDEYVISVAQSGIKYVLFEATGTKPSSDHYDIIIDSIALSSSSSSYSNYATSCCTPLGSINGSNLSTSSTGTSVSVEVLTAGVNAYGDANNVSGYDFNLYTAASGGSAAATYSSDSKAGTSHTFTGLIPLTQYWVTVRPIGSGSYCNTTEESTRRLITTTCVAPNHVDISGRWDRFGGETISLTATAYSSAGTSSPIDAEDITGYQWQKLISSTWTDVSDGTTDGVTTSGATTNNLQISNCKLNNSGKYRCIVSTGATCSTASATATDGTGGFDVKVYVLECYTGGTTVYNFTRTGDTQAGTAQITLTAGNKEFKVHADNYYYGKNVTINEDENNVVLCNSGDAVCSANLTIAAGLGGTFTISMEYSSAGGSSSVEGEPEISVTYPRKTIYLTPGVWNVDGAKFAIYYFRKVGETTYGNGWTDFITANDCGSSADIPQWNGVKMDVVRLKNTCTSPNWSDKWAQTNDITVSSNDYVTITGWNESDYTYTAYAIPTYTISYATGSVPTGGGSISGSKANETKTCGVDFDLPAAQFTTTGYVQTGWAKTDGGAQYAAVSGSYTDNSAQTFYPVWTANTHTLTWDKNGGDALTGDYTSGTVAYATAITAPNTPTWTGHTFNGWHNGSSIVTPATTMPDNDLSYTAQWSLASYTVTLTTNGGTINAGNVTSYTYGVGATLPTNVTRDGYRFDGWFTDDGVWSDQVTAISTTATGDKTYYAKWTPVRTVTWSVNGSTWSSGVVEGNTHVISGEKVSALPTAPTKSDCDDSKVFVGWRATEIDGTSASDPGGIFTNVAGSPEISADKTFYAVFADVSGGDVIEFKLPFDNKATCGVNNYTSSWVAEVDDYSWTISNFNNNNFSSGWTTDIRCGRNGNASIASITTDNAISFRVDSVYINLTATNDSYINSAKLQISSSSGISTPDEINIPVNTTGVKGLKITSPAKDKYYRVIFDCKSYTANGFVRIGSIVYKQKLDTANYVTSCSSCDADATFTNTTPAVSDIDCTSATLTMEDGLATLGADGCHVSDYGFVIGTLDNPAIGGSGVTKLQVGTSDPTVGEDFSYDATGLTKGTRYYIRAYAINRHGTAYSSSQNFWTMDVSSIAITTPPTKTNYIVGETFDATGMVVTATMASGATEDVTSDVTYSESALTSGTNQNFAINYTLCETEVSVNQKINVYTLSVTEGTNDSYGTASGSANIVSITGLGSHKTYTVTVTSDNADVVDNGDNTWSVINPTGNVAVRVDYDDAAQVKVYYKVDGVTVTGLTQDVYQSETTTLPTASELATAMTAQSMDLPDDDYPNFVGWSETEFSSQTSEPSLVSGTPVINAEKTYYAVFTNLGQIHLSADNLVGTYPSTEKTVTVGSTDFKYHYLGDANISGTHVMQFKKHASEYGYIYNNNALSNILRIEIGYYNSDSHVPVYAASAAGTIAGGALTPASRETTDPYVYTFPASTSYFMVKGDNSSTYKISYIDIYYASSTVYYMTQFCTNRVTLTQNSPEHGTVEFSRSSLVTCGSDKEVSLTIIPDVGYQLTGWTVNTSSGYADAKTTDPAVVTNSNNSAAQNITLTFAEDANKDYDVTATFGLMTVSSWAWTLNSAAIPDPLNLYVGQSARLDVAYTPAGVDASKKTYTRNKVDAYINWVGGLQPGYSTISGRATTGESTTEVTFTHADGPSTTVNVKVLPLPLVHFGDIVHNVSFDDVVATLSDNTLSPTKTTPTHADFDGSTANTCEEQHLHLVGWIREDWPALVTYLNGGAQPSTSDITTAGDDASGNAYFFAPGASINTQTFNGVTFYAVWAKVE